MWMKTDDIKQYLIDGTILDVQCDEQGIYYMLVRSKNDVNLIIIERLTGNNGLGYEDYVEWTTFEVTLFQRVM